MAILNPSFEDAGALPGEAEHWALSAVTSLEEIAGFGTAPEEAWEDFERWFELLDSIDDVVVVLAFFDSALKGYEEFESGWANVVYLYDLPARAARHRDLRRARRRGVRDGVEQRPLRARVGRRHRRDGGLRRRAARGLRGPVAQQPALRLDVGGRHLEHRDVRRGRAGRRGLQQRVDARDDAVRSKPWPKQTGRTSTTGSTSRRWTGA
jgi:hypothetical protein